MKLVILESPYRGKSKAETKRNVQYARACVRDCMLRGEAAIASHLLYTQEGILDDNVPAERTLGIAAGLAWSTVAEKAVVYVDMGISEGMREGIKHHRKTGTPVEFRSLYSIRVSQDDEKQILGSVV